MNNNPVVIIGAGPSGLMAAQKLAESGFKVHIYEQNKAAARKFLVAGHGGFNLTHSEAIDLFVQRYDKEELDSIIRNFDNKATVKWLESIGIPTYIGSSGKVFPIKSIKPIQVLKAWLNRLQQLGVQLFYEHQFLDFDNEKVTILSNGSVQLLPFYKLLMALGGGSWKKTGSTAEWVAIFKKKDIQLSNLEAANSGYNTSLSFAALEGNILKNIEVKFENIQKKGELIFTRYGIEGSAVYYLNRFTRDSGFPLKIYIDLKPDLTKAKIIEELQKSTSPSKVLKERIKLNTTALALLKLLPKAIFIDELALSEAIKNYAIEVTSLRPIDEVISTAGGVKFEELENTLALKKYPNAYCLGEMLDWEAPTGGYLLQACFSMGFWVAKSIQEIRSK